MLADARILLIRLGGLGDVVFTLPAISALREAFPGARLSFLVDEKWAPMLSGFGELETVLTLDRARYKALNPRVLLGGTLSLLAQLVRLKFELVVDFQGFGETGWLAWWSGAPQRWGTVYRTHRSWVFTRPVPRNLALHPIANNLELLRIAGGVLPSSAHRSFIVPEPATRQAQQVLREYNLDPQQPILLIQPFSSSPHKDWLLELYLIVARRLRNLGLQVLFIGGSADCSKLEPARQAGFAVAAGFPLEVSVALVGISTLALGGDTGLLHAATAMGKRVVMVMRSVQPGTCYPFGHPDWAVVPTGKSLLSSVPSAAVWGACTKALAELGCPVAAGSRTAITAEKLV